MYPVFPKKKLGQHFLADHNIARKIVSCLEADRITKVLELGAGTGMLTRYLIKNNNFKLTVVEIDRDSCEYLIKNFPEISDRLIQDDFLKLDLSRIFSNPFAIIGNFPYNISSQILFKVLENRELIHEVVCMLQKEMAERITAVKGSKTYGKLSVLLQAFYNVDYIFTVSRHVFNPPPEVQSAVIRLSRNDTKKLNCNEELFLRVVKTAFNQRRKMLKNSLKSMIPDDAAESELLSLRPEQLGVAQFVDLTNFVDPVYFKHRESEKRPDYRN
jgi:16S rRNA (adenine1518-N6/adenine1519-N6)-dimethyltransferase